MARLREKLNALNAHSQCHFQCTCGAPENMQKAEQGMRLIQFLMGLNEVYTVIKGNILTMNPLSSLAQAFLILIQEEKQRAIKPQNQIVMESTAQNAIAPENSSFKTNYNHNTTGNNGIRGNYNPNMRRLLCNNFKIPGHIRDKYYKLHRYP